MRFGQYIGRQPHSYWWVGNDSAGAGGSSDAGKTDDAGKQDDAGDASKADVGKTFTQADVDRLMAQRESRDRDKLRKELEPELRAKLEAEAKTAALKEQEQFKPLYEAEQAKAAKAEADLAAQAELARDRLLRAEVRVAAAQLNVVDPTDAYRLLDVAAVTYDDAGEPTNVEALLKALVEAKPYLVKSDAREGIPGTRRGDGAGSETVKEHALTVLSSKYEMPDQRKQAAS